MIEDYKDLEVWKRAINIVIDTYKAISHLPNAEKYALSDQLRRSSVSVPSNIAEGHNRQTTKEYIQFLYIALGSLSELETQCILVSKLYSIDINSLNEEITILRKMLNKLIASLKRRLK